MKYHVIVHDTAMDDVERNARWWLENYSKDEALRWYELAFQKIYSLEAFPTRHGLSAENADFPFEIRDLLFGPGSRPSYRAIFTIQENVVHVLAVRRSSQDKLYTSDVDFHRT